MDRKTAEVLYQISEFVSEKGQWFSMCEFLESKGLTAQEIADAINKTAKAAGHTSQLSASDCE